MGLRWERKLLDHVDWFPSQPKWTYRLETSVLDVKIPVAAPVSQQPLSLSLSPLSITPPPSIVIALLLSPHPALVPDLPPLHRSSARLSL